MKLNQLRKIIREEVRSAVKEELQDILNEAVKHASAPVVEHKQVNVEVPTPTKTNPVAGKTSIEQMLEMTKNNMTNEEYKNVFSGTSDMVTGMPNMASTMATQMGRGAGQQPGLDISNLEFVKKAGAVLKASEEKDKQKASLA
jgi:hypothetical protein